MGKSHYKYKFKLTLKLVTWYNDPFCIFCSTVELQLRRFIKAFHSRMLFTYSIYSSSTYILRWFLGAFIEEYIFVISSSGRASTAPNQQFSIYYVHYMNPYFYYLLIICKNSIIW